MFPCSFPPKQTPAEKAGHLRARTQQAERVAFAPLQILELFPALSAWQMHPKAHTKRKNGLHRTSCSHEVCLQRKRHVPEASLQRRRWLGWKQQTQRRSGIPEDGRLYSRASLALLSIVVRFFLSTPQKMQSKYNNTHVNQCS